MKRRTKNLVIITAIFVIITIAGGIYTLAFQKKDLDEQDIKLNELKANYSSLDALNTQLRNMEEKVTVVDSLLFTGKFSIPKNLSQSRFFNFIDAYSKDNSLYTFTNTEYISSGVDNGFNFYTYKVSGNGSFDNVYGLVYAIEHSKELKKIEMANFSSSTSVDQNGVPRYIVKFEMQVKVYFSSSDQYAAVTYSENELNISGAYDAFFPLVRNEIRPNVSNLPDIQGGTLLSLVPHGAFVTDSKGNTLLLKKGDQVYLGYLMDIDYADEEVTFVLNKGGIIEYQTLIMGKKNNN